MRARLIRDGTAVEIAGSAWSEVIGLDQLDNRLAFYRRLRDREGGRYASFFIETVRELEAVARAVAEQEDRAAPAVANAAAAGAVRLEDCHA